MVTSARRARWKQRRYGDVEEIVAVVRAAKTARELTRPRLTPVAAAVAIAVEGTRVGAVVVLLEVRQAVAVRVSPAIRHRSIEAAVERLIAVRHAVAVTVRSARRRSRASERGARIGARARSGGCQ